MTKFINAFTHTEMWVSDDRVEEYKEAGHKLASESTEEAVKEEKPKRTRTKK